MVISSSKPCLVKLNQILDRTLKCIGKCQYISGNLYHVLDNKRRCPEKAYPLTSTDTLFPFSFTQQNLMSDVDYHVLSYEHLSRIWNLVQVVDHKL